jgi:arylsulfatase A-like enzyme
MKAIMVMYDSLNRHFLSPYRADSPTSNFDRLAKKCVTFDTCYAGSLPCMPARRELHTGRYNFLHRSWGPLEPYDDSTFSILQENGIYCHLVSDHYHYLEDGGATYHNRYSSWEILRGQEGDHWKGRVLKKPFPPHLGQMMDQDQINREYIIKNDMFPQKETFKRGLEFLENNWRSDDWFLQIETFDPHEPFFIPTQYQIKNHCSELCFDWPFYAPVSEDEKPYVDHVRNCYRDLLRICDENLGKILDFIDSHDLWRDTMFIVNTDHGYMLGEHGWWAKANDINFYEEVSHIPLFIHDPRVRKSDNTRCSNLVQTVDIAPTLLDFFGANIPKDMGGKSLKNTIENGSLVREAALFGIHGAQINCTDGRYVYVRAPRKENEPLYEYTLMPTHMRHTFYVEEMRTAAWREPFAFTKECGLMKIKDLRMGMTAKSHNYKTSLFDLEKDPGQKEPIDDAAIEKKMIDHMHRLMHENDCPEEQFDRVGLT